MTDQSPAPQADLLTQLQRIFRNEKQRRRKTARLPLPLLESLLTYLKGAALRGELRDVQADALLLSPEETAELLGVTIGTLANWRTRGVVPLDFVQCGSRIRYRASDVHAYLERQRATHTR